MLHTREAVEDIRLILPVTNASKKSLGLSVIIQGFRSVARLVIDITKIAERLGFTAKVSGSFSEFKRLLMVTQRFFFLAQQRESYAHVIQRRGLAQTIACRFAERQSLPVKLERFLTVASRGVNLT